MDFRKITKTAALATIGIIITGTSAFAFAAKSQTALNVRSGPGTGYNVVDALYTGETVNVNKCTKSKKMVLRHTQWPRRLGCCEILEKGWRSQAKAETKTYANI